MKYSNIVIYSKRVVKSDTSQNSQHPTEPSHPVTKQKLLNMHWRIVTGNDKKEGSCYSH